jgi:hypothetical protein
VVHEVARDPIPMMCRDETVWSWPDLLLAVVVVYGTTVCTAFLYLLFTTLSR